MITARKGEWFILKIPEKWSNYSLQELFYLVWQAPKKQTHSLRIEKRVKLNGQDPNWLKKLNTGDVLEIQFFIDQECSIHPFYYDLSILYEDDHLLVVNKPANMDTHPNSNEQKDTLANAVTYYLQSKGEYRAVKHIHRLDRHTTGAVLFAKYPFICSILDGLLEKRNIKRTYVAIVEGMMANKKGTINAPIGRDRHHATRRRVSPSGQKAITHYEVLKVDQKRKLSLVKCQLDTGRTHQIRVHFSSIKHPLVGDELYGGKPTFQRQALHAVKLEFTHPLTDEYIMCHAPFLDEPAIFTLDPYSI